MSGCTPLVEQDSVEGTTAVTIDIRTALVGLECGIEPGAVARFAISSPSVPGPREADCGEPIVIEELSGGTFYRFDVLAFEAAAERPTWRTRCSQRAINGVTLAAACDPLVRTLQRAPDASTDGAP